MKKIRRGNDFVFAWEIERNGLPEDLSSVLEKHLYLSVLGKRVELLEGVDYDITGNVVRIEVTPTIANILGTYKAEFHYILPDNGLIDEDRKCAVDVDAFVIVGSTAQADEPSEFTVTSDMAIAFKGDKGDPLTYDDLTPEQIAELQQPATDAIASIQEVELAVETAEGLRVQAELNRQTNTSTAISNAEQATDDANDAAILANEKAGLAATATTEANTARDEANLAATAANTAAGDANTAAEAANTAAGLADAARLAIEGELALKADQTELDQLAGDVYDALGLKKIPQKLIIGEADYSYDPESTSGLTAAGGSLSLNTEQVYAGNYSVKFSGNNSGNTNISKSISLTDEMLNSFKVAVYMHDVQLPTDSIRVDLHDGTYNKYMTQTFTVGANRLQPGKWTLLGGKNWAKCNNAVASDITTIRITLNGFRTTEISIDLIEFGLKRHPSCLITFDDGKLTDYTNAYPSLRARGMVATAYIVSDYVGTPNFMANNHLHELYENGWCIGNHTKSHDNLNTMTVPEQIASLSGCNDYLNNIGITTGLHAAYPYNAIDNSNILEVVQSVGLKTGRTSGAFGNMHDGWNYPFFNLAYSHDQPVDPDGIAIKNHIDRCILNGRTPAILFHEVGTTSAYISQQTFDNILDYIKSLGLTTLNMDEFYRLNANDVVINHK